MRRAAQRFVTTVFSDSVMVFLALLVIPLLIAEFVPLSAVQRSIVTAIDIVIYTAFFLEFVLKVAVADDRVGYLRRNAFVSAISLVIIVSPLLLEVSTLFIATPLLRLVSVIRLSRATRVLALSGRARSSWRKVTLRTYVSMGLIVAAGFIGSFFKPNIPFSEDDLAAYVFFIQFIGTVYAIITGFVVANVWNKFMTLKSLVRKEAAALSTVLTLAYRFKNRGFERAFEDALHPYLDALLAFLWERRGSPKTLDEGFHRLMGTLSDATTTDEMDRTVFDKVVDTFRDATMYRSDILSLHSSRIPPVLWLLLLVLSPTLAFGFYLMPFENQVLSTITLTLVATVVALVLGIVYDMENAFTSGFWIVDPSPYLSLHRMPAGSEHGRWSSQPRRISGVLMRERRMSTGGNSSR
jgi:hypothetical protein